MADKQEFIQSLEKMERTFPNARRHCSKRGCVVTIQDLLNLECWNCPHFILNNGICDPL